MCIYAYIYTLVTSSYDLDVMPSMCDSGMKLTKELMCENHFKFCLKEAEKAQTHTHMHAHSHTDKPIQALTHVLGFGVLAPLIKEPNQFACGDSIYQTNIVNRCGCCCRQRRRRRRRHRCYWSLHQTSSHTLSMNEMDE